MSTVSIRYIVTDVDAAIGFYAGHLGFQVQLHPNDLFAMLNRGDLRLLLVKPTGPGGPPGGGAPMPDGTRQEPGGWNKAYDQQMHATVPLPPPNQLQVQSQHLTDPLYQQ